MEDRYLFCAKRMDNGEWVEGFLFQLCYDSIFCWCIGNEPLSPNDYSELCGFNREWFYIDESTICQCTGLMDKNGKLIWENNVVTGWFDDKRITGYIKYGSNGIFYIERNRLYGIHLDNSQDWLEVIGNIFDNQELLEQEG